MARTPDRADFDPAWLDGLLDRTLANLDLLGDRDVEFVAGLAERWNKFTVATFLSERQVKWLRDIEGRLDKAANGDAEARPVDEVIR